VEADLSWQSIVGRLLLAALLGGVMGLEREADGHDAGLRTHMLLALGSALFAVASVGAFDHFQSPRNETNFTVDVTRMAAYVAPGVGFIGAGVIVKNARGRRHAGLVRGLTTAASLWTAAAIGVASGLGFWIGAVTTATVALFALVVMRPIAERLRPEPHGGPPLELEVHVDDRFPLDAAALVSTVRTMVPAGAPPEARHDGDVRSFRFRLDGLPPESVDALVASLSEQPGVRLVCVHESS
jgi:putative Mg2+ transporter-C (MgtC) family protein